MDGLVLINKSSGPTSHDCVARLRRILKTKKIGHFGTLDPFAEGLLLAGVGKATRLFPYFGFSDKTYEGTIRLGFATDTYDRTGSPAGPEAEVLPDRGAVAAAMARFSGEQVQLAPAFSAKKLDGKPLYAYARNGIEVERRPARIRVDRFELMAFDPPFFTFAVACSAGTYIRSLAHDLGEALGCGAHLSRLIRTSSGPYRLEAARTLEDIESIAGENRMPELLLPLEELLPNLPSAELTAAGQDRIRNGRPVALNDPEQVSPPEISPISAEIIRLFGPDGRLAALARRREFEASPFLVLI